MKYTSVFAPYIIGLIEEKRSLGYKYSSQLEILRRFDRFCCEYYPNESVLSREIMLAWAAKRPGEHPGTLQGRITPVKELAKYIDTAYYLHLAADLFPNITKQVENILGDINRKQMDVMKTTDFAKHLTAFFGNYLPGVKNLSENTILSYRDAFRLLLVFFRDIRGIAPEKLSFKMFNVELVCDFLNWLQNERNCSIATRNQRLIAIHAFFRYVQVQEPKQIFLCQQILQIPTKKYQQSIVAHLSPEQMKALLAAPDSSTHRGRRDMTLLSVLYDTGARVQELCDLCVKDIRLEHPAIITLTGKGRKIRHVPILGTTVELLRIYLKENKIFLNGNPDAPLFFNQRYSKLTRGGVSHILQKYAESVSEKISEYAEDYYASYD